MQGNSLTTYIEGVYAPVSDERTDPQLTVIGEIPSDICGAYVQNNPNPHFKPQGLYHWFDGDGMIHGVQIREGQATYQNRYIQTNGLLAEKQANKILWKGILEPFPTTGSQSPDKDTANTDLIFHNGKLLATWWLSGQPYGIDPITFQTLGPENFSNTLQLSVAAHPKVDPRTGELIFFSYNPYEKPYLQSGIISPQGKCSHTATLDCDLPSLFHDIAITENYTIFLDLPMNWDPQKLTEGKRRVRFHPNKPARFGIMPRYDNGSNCKWFSLPACYIYHTINAHEEKDEHGNTVVVMYCCRIENPLPTTDHTNELTIPRLFFLRLHPFLYEFRFNLGTGEAKQKQVDDYPTEFPRINDNYLGVKNQWSYHPRIAKEPSLLFDGFIKYQTKTGKSQHVVYGQSRIGGETVFVPRENAKQEDDGYLMSFVIDRAKSRSELVIYHAQTLDRLAQVLIPRRIPFGFHASWAPQQQKLAEAK